MSKTLGTDEQFISAAAKHLVQQVLHSLQEEEEQEDMDQQATKSDQLKTQSSPECFSPSKPSVPDRRLDNKETSTSQVESPLKLTPYGDQDAVDVKTPEVSPIPTTQTSQLVSSTTSVLTIEDVTSVEEPPFPPTTPPRLPVPVFSFIQPLAEFLIGPTIEVSEMLFPLKSDSELAPGGRIYAQIRGSGVGATSPGSPRQCVALLEPVSPTSDSTWLVNDNLITNECKDFQSVTKVPIPNNGAPSLDTITAVSGVQRPTQTLSQITLGEQIPTAYGNSAFEVENLTGKRQKTSYSDDINKKLEPFTQTLPTYTPSRVYLRTINHNFEPDSIGMVYATADYRERYASTHRVLNAGNPSVQNEVPRLILPATPREPRNPRKSVEERLSPCPICPRYLCRPLKNVTSTRQFRPLRKQYSLSWWQPLNSTDPSRFTLPEPNAKLMRQLIQEQTAREKRLTDAIALAHREAQSHKAEKFRKIRQRAQITSDRRSKVLVKGSAKEMMPLNTNGNQKSFCAHSVRISGMKIVPPTDEPQQNFQNNIIQRTGRKKHSHHTNSTSPSNCQQHSVRLNVTRLNEVPKRSSSIRLLSPDNRRPTSRSKSASRATPQVKQKPLYGHTRTQAMHKPRSTDPTEIHSNNTVPAPTVQKRSTTQPTVAKKAKASTTRESIRHKNDRSDPKSHNGDPESKWKDSLRKSDSPVRLSKRGKPTSSNLLTRLRGRCHSIEREMEQMDREQYRTPTNKSDHPYSDARVEALSSANQTLRTRLDELQRLQTERESALRKARQMVDTLISKQQMQADMIRSNTNSLRVLGTSEWSLTSAKPSDTADYVEESMNNPGSHWSQYPEPTTIGGENMSDFIGPKPASDRKLKTSPSSRRHWMTRVQQMDSQVTSTHQILDRLRNDYAELARSVSRIEQKTREAAASVHTMMGHSMRSSSPERTISATNSYSPQTDFRTGHWIDPSVESRLQNTRMTLETLRNDPIRYSNSGLSEIGQPYRSLTSYRGYSGTPGVDFVRSSWTGNV